MILDRLLTALISVIGFLLLQFFNVFGANDAKFEADIKNIRENKASIIYVDTQNKKQDESLKSIFLENTQR